MHDIKHIWLDFSDTLAFPKKEKDELIYRSYAEVVGKPVSPELIQEFKELAKKYKSNSAVFASGLCLPSGYLADRIDSVDPRTLYELADPNIPEVLNTLRQKMPLSIFSNMRMEKLLPAIGLDLAWFAHILSGAEFKNPKPALDGFYKIVEVSQVPAKNILFIGDSVDKELIPAKKVGMVTGIMWGESAEADYSFKDFNDILRILS